MLLGPFDLGFARVRFARLIVLSTLAVAPAVAFAALTAEEVTAEMARLPQQLPGRYRSTIELLRVDGPIDSKQRAEILRSMPGKDDRETTLSCGESDEPPGFSGPQLVQEVLDDGCEFERFEAKGETFSALVACPAGRGLPERVTMDGTVEPTRVDLLVTTEQKDEGLGVVKAKMRFTFNRIGDCS